jgi:hypothetical protein
MIAESDTPPCTVGGLRRSYRTVTYHFQRSWAALSRGRCATTTTTRRPRTNSVSWASRTEPTNALAATTRSGRTPLDWQRNASTAARRARAVDYFDLGVAILDRRSSACASLEQITTSRSARRRRRSGLACPGPSSAGRSNVVTFLRNGPARTAGCGSVTCSHWPTGAQSSPPRWTRDSPALQKRARISPAGSRLPRQHGNRPTTSKERPLSSESENEQHVVMTGEFANGLVRELVRGCRARRQYVRRSRA